MVRTFFDLFGGAGGLGMAFRSAGFRCLGLVEPSSIWGNSYRLNLDDEEALTALGRKATIKPTTVLDRLDGRQPDVLLAQPLWPKLRSAKGRNRKSVFLAPPNDWFGDPRNAPFERVLHFVKTLTPRLVVIPHLERVANRRDLGLLALHCTALRCLGYTVLPAQINHSWYGAPRPRFQVVLLAARDIRLSELSLFWPPDRLFRCHQEDPGWVRTTRRVASLLDTWYPLAPPARAGIPQAPTLTETLEDLPAAASPWMGGTAPLDAEMEYTRHPYGWFARHLRRWESRTGELDRLTMHVCIPRLWLGDKKKPDLHMGWVHDVQCRKAALEARERGEDPPPKELYVPLPEFLTDGEDGETEEGVWVKMPPAPVPGTPPLLWQDRFLRLFTGGSPDRTHSLREEARLKTFPDSWRFAGGFVERVRQIQAAFPPLPGLIIARTLQALLDRKAPTRTLLPECPVAPHPRPPEERRRSEGSRGRMGELPFS